jgi:hypothetical protein
MAQPTSRNPGNRLAIKPTNGRDEVARWPNSKISEASWPLVASPRPDRLVTGVLVRLPAPSMIEVHRRVAEMSTAEATGRRVSTSLLPRRRQPRRCHRRRWRSWRGVNVAARLQALALGRENLDRGQCRSDCRRSSALVAETWVEANQNQRGRRVFRIGSGTSASLKSGNFLHHKSKP